MKKFRAHLAALALVAAGTVAAVAPASPAQASYGEVCFTVHDTPTTTTLICVPLLIPTVIDPDPQPCEDPRWVIDYSEDPVLPVDLRREYLGGVARGLGLLDQARAATDPAQVRRIRNQALHTFTGAAQALNQARVSLASVDPFDFTCGTPPPFKRRWLKGIGNDIANGLNLLCRALAEPDPDTWFTAALASFDRAHAGLTQPVPAG
jgi:hypothetical protein